LNVDKIVTTVNEIKKTISSQLSRTTRHPKLDATRVFFKDDTDEVVATPTPVAKSLEKKAVVGPRTKLPVSRVHLDPDMF